MDAFSMAVRKPEQGDPERAVRIRAAASSYVTAARDIAAGNAEGEKKVKEFHKGVDDLKGEQEKTEDGQAKNDDKGSAQPPKKHKGRSRNSKPPKPESGDGEPS